jgi:RHS repeat-associated protein
LVNVQSGVRTLVKAFAPLPGGGTAVYNSSGLAWYRHADSLGSSRIASTASGTMYYDGAYSPMGEMVGEVMAKAGTQDRNFTGQNADLAPDLFDFQYRDYHPIHGRWLSPDPAGMASVDPSDPQTWNRYAYVRGNPLAMTDPDGQGIFADLFSALSLVADFFGVPIPPVAGWDIGEGIDVMRGETPGLGTFLQGMGLSIAGIGGNPVPTGGTWGSGQVAGGPVFSALGTQTTWQYFQSYWSTAGFLFNFATGTGPRIRYYGPRDYRVLDLMSSKGFTVINQQIKRACQAGATGGKLDLGSWQAAKDIPYDVFHSPVGGEVGGYNGTWSIRAGTARIQIVNYAGTYSFFYHAVNDRTGISGPFRTIKQTFDIEEPNPCPAR